MPRKGNKSITIREGIYLKAEQRAKEVGKSVAGLVSDLILKCQMEVPAQ